MSIDFLKYQDVDYEVPADLYSWAYSIAGEIGSQLDLAYAYVQMSAGYLNAGDEICKTAYAWLANKNNEDAISMIGPMIRLYYHAIELLVKATAVLLGIQANRMGTHRLSKIFQQVKNDLANISCLNEYENIEECIGFLEWCDKHNMGSQFGRYPVDKHGNPMAIVKDDKSGKSGYLAIGLMQYAHYIHSGTDILQKFYLQMRCKKCNAEKAVK